jgi:hypothetical protein
LEAIAMMMPPTGPSRATATKAPARQGICSRSVSSWRGFIGAQTSPASLGASRKDGSGFDRVQSPPVFGGGPTTCIDEH